LKHINFGVITLLLFGMVILLTGIVSADQPVPAVPETQGLLTSTYIDTVGMATETDAGAWQLTNNAASMVVLSSTLGTTTYAPLSWFTADGISQLLASGGSYTLEPEIVPQSFATMSIPSSLLSQPISGGLYGIPATWQRVVEVLTSTGALGFYYQSTNVSGGLHTGTLNPGEVQYTTAYDANVVAQGGHTTFVKQMNLHTGNKAISQSNLNAQTGLTYAATSEGGNVVGSENLMLDGAGMNTTASDKIICPFAAGIASAIPAYCNIVQAGSKYDLTIGSVTTTADNRFVGNDASIPVVLNYNINVKPYSTTQGQFPASGSTMAYIKVHVQEGRGNGTAKAEDLSYSETSSAIGRITAFNKLMSYSSQLTGSSTNVMHTITPIGSGISPSTPVTVPDGGSATFYQTHTAQGSSVTPSVEYYWSVDGEYRQTYQNSYTFTNVVSDHTISREK
jgi:hypothetical protein